MSNDLQEIITQAAKLIRKELKPKEWLSPAEAAELLNCKRTTLYSFCNKGYITYSQVTGKGRLYNYKSILKYIESKKVRAFKI